MAAAVTLQEAADRLGVHYMTAYRYVRTGRLPARRVGGQWQVDPADLRAVMASAGSPGRLVAEARGHSRAELRRRLVDRLIAGDEAGSWALVETALARGATPEEIVVDVVAPAMGIVGERWQSGQLTVDDEHGATSVVLRLVGRLGPHFTRRGVKRGTVVLGTPPGERHGLPTALATNVLRGRGYDVVDLGADVPVHAFAAAVSKVENPLTAAIGVTAGNHDRAVRAIVRAIHEKTPGVPVLVGGAGVADAAHASRLGAEWAGTDATTLVAAVDALYDERS
jgi:excisionase family DNA binding protein